MESLLPSHLYMGSKDPTQVTRFTWQVPLPPDPFCQSPVLDSFVFETRSRTSQADLLILLPLLLKC